jgi:hypothetical protein
LRDAAADLATLDLRSRGNVPIVGRRCGQDRGQRSSP